VALRPVNTAGPTNIADPNTKALGCLAFLCVCHACRSRLCASLCQAIFSHKRSHVRAGICRSWSNQQHKSESKNKGLHHRIETQTLSVACPVPQDYAPESVTFNLGVGRSSPRPNIAGAHWGGFPAALRTQRALERRCGLRPRGIFAKLLLREIVAREGGNSDVHATSLNYDIHSPLVGPACESAIVQPSRPRLRRCCYH
jgi:hypothetical protein